jgi:hypothetical protein
VQRDERRGERAAHPGSVLGGIAHAVAERDDERSDHVEIVIHGAGDHICYWHR